MFKEYLIFLNRPLHLQITSGSHIWHHFIWQHSCFLWGFTAPSFAAMFKLSQESKASMEVGRCCGSENLKNPISYTSYILLFVIYSPQDLQSLWTSNLCQALALTATPFIAQRLCLRMCHCEWKCYEFVTVDMHTKSTTSQQPETGKVIICFIQDPERLISS